MKPDAANTKSVDLLNIGLIFVSLVAAFKVPFHLFLFSYAVLGPLHYLTEINWLGEKSYFVKERKWVSVFVLMAILFSLPAFFQLPTTTMQKQFADANEMIKLNKELILSVVSFSILFAVTLVYVRKWQNVVLLTILNLAAIAAVLTLHLFSFAFVAVFVPTIFHVYFFTLLFMLYGTMKSRNTAGYVACAFLLLCPLIIWKNPIAIENYAISESVQRVFLKSSFQNVTTSMAAALGISNKGEMFQLLSEEGIRIQIFIAFCYTYHYLNWFSKTSIIGWGRNISRKRFALVVGIWIISVCLYWYDYQIGLTALLIMSMTHVFFEFPLNVQSIQGVFQGIIKRQQTP